MEIAPAARSVRAARGPLLITANPAKFFPPGAAGHLGAEQILSDLSAQRAEHASHTFVAAKRDTV
jgi:hypothetical protein